MTSQMPDVQVTSREVCQRTFVHSVLSFGLNMLILALSINVAAGMLKQAIRAKACFAQAQV